MSATYENRVGFRFGGFFLDTDRGELYRQDTRIQLRPRSFDVLRYLLEHPAKLVSRDELMDALWNGAVVTEDAVTQCLIDVRKALHDDAQSIIRTVPRRGYIFELDVERVDDTADQAKAVEPDRSIRSLMIAGVTGVLSAVLVLIWQPWLDEGAAPFESSGVDPRNPSIAIMPFESMGRDAKDSYFADGISEEIINTLASQSGIKVIARTSSFSFRDQNVDVATIASRLKVTHVLEGSVRFDGDLLRINVQLVDAASGEYFWTRQYDRGLSASGLFAIQSEIATAVVESLVSELDPAQRNRLSRIPTDNLPALDAYFEARQAMETRRPRELARAAELLRSAIDADSEFALAYVALADTLRLQAGYGALPHNVASEQGMMAVQMALRIDPDLGNTYASLGNLYARFGNPQAAEEAFLRGIELSPGYAPLYQWYGEFLIYYGRGYESVPFSRIAVALDPRSPIINTDYAEALAGAGRLEDALAQYDVALSIDPEFTPALTGKAGVLSGSMGRIADALPLLEKARSSSPMSPQPSIELARAYFTLGDDEAADRLLDDAARIAPDHNEWRAMAMVFDAVRGHADSAAKVGDEIVAAWGGYPSAMRILRDHDIANGDVESAVKRYRGIFPYFFAESEPLVGGGNVSQAIDLSYALMLAGRERLAQTLLKASLDHLATRPRLAWEGTGIADVKVQAILGNTDRALQLLQETVDAGWRVGWRFELMLDPALAKLRLEPGFADIIGRIEADLEQQRRERDRVE